MIIRKAAQPDISAMVTLSYEKRREYEKFQPQFWRHAEGAETTQANWFAELLTRNDYLLLIAESEEQMLGFVIGQIITAPQVYDPHGMTLMIDDFCVKTHAQWQTIGAKLIDRITADSKEKGATQLLVVCGAHDMLKREFLIKSGLNVISEWYVRGI